MCSLCNDLWMDGTQKLHGVPVPEEGVARALSLAVVVDPRCRGCLWQACSFQVGATRVVWRCEA